MAICHFLVILMLVSSIKCANIFCIFPTPSFSHQQPMLAISRVLAERGHNLTVITANPSEVPIKNHRDIDLNFLYKMWELAQDEHEISLQHRMTPSQMVSTFYPNFIKFMSTNALESQQIQDLIKEVNGTKYDLILFENIGYSALLGFADLIGNPPLVGLLTMNQCEIADLSVGNVLTSSYIPNLLTDCDHKMTFFERLFNFYISTLTQYTLEKIFYYEEMLLKKHFSDIPHTTRELVYNVSLQIFISDLATSYPRPVQPNTIFIGPTHIQPPKPLPQDLQKWMDEAEDGVIYFSLGSNMKGTSLPHDIVSIFIKTFSQFPKTRVLWKWESDELPGQPKNVLIKKWLPQMAVLAHPNLKLFISQVGAQSLQESIYNGIPILGIPLFADQMYNARKLAESGAGIVQEFNKITCEEIYPKIKDILTTPSYKKNILRLSEITKDKPMSSIDTAIWWIEYVLRHNGASHLRPAVLDLKWYQYYMLDMLFSILLLIVISVFLVYYTLAKLVLPKFRSYNKIKTS